MDAFSKIEQVGEAEQRRAWRIGMTIFYILLFIGLTGYVLHRELQ